MLTVEVNLQFYGSVIRQTQPPSQSLSMNLIGSIHDSGGI
jgi:hypothetical protein